LAGIPQLNLFETSWKRSICIVAQTMENGGITNMKFLRALGNFIMRFIHAVGALVVLACAMIVSFQHSIELFEKGAGYQGYQSIVIVVAIEVVFIMSAAVIMNKRMNGEKPGAYTISGGIFGLIVVMWGNIRVSLDYGIEGILLGLAVPIAVVLAEGIFGEAVRRQPTHQPEVKVVHDMEPITQVEQDAPPVATQTVEPSPAIVDEAGDLITQVEDDKPILTTKVITSPLAIEDVAKPDSTAEQTTAKTPTTSDEVATNKVAKVAMDLKKQLGRYPGRKRLATVAGVTEHRARLVLDQLKEQQPA
jgi:hypothetical protein